MIEGYIKHGDTKHFQSEIDQYTIDGQIEDNEISWFNNNKAEDLINKLNINTSSLNNTDAEFRDNIASELMMVSKSLGLGTSHDGFVEHSDGSASLVDYKTGIKFLNDAFTTEKMQYNDGLPTKIVNSKVNKAMLELVMRMIVAKMNRPNLAIRDLKIAHVSKNFKFTVKSVPVQIFLDYINNNLKISIRESEKEYKKNATPELKIKIDDLKQKYEAMKQAKVFDFSNYKSQAKELAEDEYNLQDEAEVTGQLDKIEDRISNTAGQIVGQTGGTFDMFDPQLKKLKDVTLNLLNFFKHAKEDDLSTALGDESVRDINFFAKHVKGLRFQTNKFLQAFSNYYEDKAAAAHKEKMRLTSEQSTLVKADTNLVREWKQRTGKTVIKTFSYQKDNNPVPVSEQGIYDFMYTFRVIGNDSVRTGAIYTEQDVKDGKITQIQYDYYKAVKETLKEKYELIRNKIAYRHNGKNVTYGQLYKSWDYKFDAFDESFLPTIPFLGPEEIIEKNIQQGKVSPKTIVSEIWNNHIQSYDLSVQNDQKRKMGLPLKYMSNAYFNNDDHSFNVTAAVTAFTNHMTEKEYMDDVYNTGSSLVNIMYNDKDNRGKPRLQNSIDYLESYLDQHILGKHRLTTEYTGSDKLNKFIDNSIDNTGSFIHKNAFWFSPVTAASNYIFGKFTQGKEALVSTLSKRMLGTENTITPSSIARAEKIWWGHEKEQFTKRSNAKRQFDKDFTTLYYEDKVNFMMKNFRLNNKNYKFVDHSIMNSVHNRIFSQETPMVFQGMSEDASNEVLMIASLVAKKIEIKKLENGQEVTYYLKKDGSLTTDPKEKDLQNM